MAEVFDNYEWTCDDCGTKYRIDVKRVQANNIFRTVFMNVKCACGGDSAHCAEFPDTQSMSVVNQPPGSRVMGIL